MSLKPPTSASTTASRAPSTIPPSNSSQLVRPTSPAPTANTSSYSTPSTKPGTAPPPATKPAATKPAPPPKKTYPPLPEMKLPTPFKPYTKPATKNTDATLGGELHRPPGLTGPGCPFNFFCSNTPDTVPNKRLIIPWDHVKKDYVYSAIKDEDIKEISSRKDLKKKVDTLRKEPFWDPVGSYNLMFWVLIGIMIFALILGIILLIALPAGAAKWIIIIILLLLIIGGCIFGIIFSKGKANTLTQQRREKLDQLLFDYCKNSTTKIMTGEATSYLYVTQGVSMAPTMGSSNPLQSKPSGSQPGSIPPTPPKPPQGGNSGQTSQYPSNQPPNFNKPPPATLATSTHQIPIPGPQEKQTASARNIGPNDLDTSTAKLNSSFDNALGKSAIETSSKRRTFLERLEVKKSGGTPTKVSIGPPAMNYESVKPDVELHLHEGKTLNLNIDEDFA